MKKEKFELAHYKYSEEITAMLSPIAELIKSNKIILAEKKIAMLALNLLSKINSNIMTPKEANKYFTLLDVYLGDNFPKLHLRNEVQDLILEGMVLHDLGNYYGADIKLMKLLANKTIAGKKSKWESLWKKVDDSWEKRFQNKNKGGL